jgi:DNA-binding protein H-NS
MSYESIQKQIQKLQAQAKKLEASQSARKSKSISQVRALMKKLNVSITDLDHSIQHSTSNQKAHKVRSSEIQKATKSARPPVLPKYKHPQTTETWTGRGKPPKWLAALLAQGHAKEAFLIATTKTIDSTESAPIK